MATINTKKFDELNVQDMSKSALEETKYMLECELAWVQQEMAQTSESLMIDNNLDAFNKFNHLLKEVNFKLKILKG